MKKVIKTKKKRKNLKNNLKSEVILPNSFFKTWKVNMTEHYLVKKDA